MIIIKKQIENYPHFDLQRHLQISSQNTIPSSITISRVQSIYHHRKPSKRIIPPTQKSRHFFDRRNFYGSGQQWLEEEEEGILPSFFLRRLPCARARLNHIDLLPTWLIGNLSARFIVLQCSACMHTHTHAPTCACARYRLSNLHI